MKGKKLVFAVILSLIVCLLLLPTAYADGENVTEHDSDAESVADNAVPIAAGNNSESDNNLHDGFTVNENADNSENKDGASENEEQSDENNSSPDLNKNENEGGNNFLGDNSGEDSDTTGENKNTTGGDTTDDDNADDDNSDADDSDKDEGNSQNDSANGSAPDNGSIGDGASSQSESKSSFMVELSYNGTSHKLNNLTGNEQFDLAEILTALGIKGNIETAQSGAEELFAAESGENGWSFTTKKAFGSKETLTVVVDGVEYVLSVVDDIDVGTAEALAEGIANGGAYRLTADIAGHFEVAEGKTVTIDLNGHILSNSGKPSSGSYLNKATITNYGILIIKDSSENKTGRLVSGSSDEYALKNGLKKTSGGDVTGTATLESGTITNFVAGTAGADCVIWNQGTLTIKDGATVEVAITKNGTHFGIRNANAIALTVDGGVFKYCGAGNGRFITNECNLLTINGGTFECGNCSASIWSTKGTVYINGGTFNADKSSLRIFAPSEAKKYNFNRGIFGNDTIKDYVDDSSVITRCGSLYALNDSGYEFAKSGNTVEIVKAPADYEIDNVPEGVTVTNSSENTIVVNGVTVVSGTSYTTATPVTPVAPLAPQKTAAVAAADEVLSISAKYFVVDGKAQSWTGGSADGLKFELNSNDVVKVLIDGVEVMFTVEDGKIVISADVLEKLDAGEHEIKFGFADGSCKTEFTVK